MSDLDRRLDAIAGEDEWARHRQLETLRSTGLRPGEIGQLCDVLGGDDATRRAAARMALAALAAPESVCHDEAQAVLHEALRSAGANVRVLVASALGAAGDPTAGQALIAALEAPDPNVKAAAADALGELRHAGALDALGRLSRTEDLWVRAAAIVALGRLQDEQAIPILAHLADEPGLEKPIVEALGRINHPGALDVLQRVHVAVPDEALRTAGGILSAHPELEPPEWVRAAAREDEEALRHELVEADDPALARLLGLAGSPEAVDSLVALVGPPRRSEAAIGGLLAAPPEQRADAIFRRLPDADDREVETLLSVLPPLKDADRIHSLVAFLEHPVAAVRAAAADAMARAPAPEAFPLLEAEMEREGVAPEVIRAVGNLGEMACMSLVPLLEDEVATVRAAAANALSRCAGTGVEANLRAALAGEEEELTREALILALARASGREAMDVLLEALDSNRRGTRLAAIEGLGMVGHEAALPPLERAVDRTAPECLAALHALGRLGEPAGAPLLARYLRAEDLEVRRAAAGAAVRMAAAMDPAVGERMAEDEDAWIRTCGARVLARTGDDPGGRLERMAREDPDPDVRSAARSALTDAG